MSSDVGDALAWCIGGGVLLFILIVCIAEAQGWDK